MDSLKCDGFHLIPDYLSPQHVRQLLSELADLPHAHAHRNLLRHPAVKTFAVSPQTLSCITPTLGPNAFPVRAILFDKLPTANWKVPWHQDLPIAIKHRIDTPGFGPWSLKEGVPHVQPPLAILESMLTLRLHLDDCFENNGPVRLLPATHRLGILTPDQIQSCRHSIPELPATSPAGGILLMRPLLLHASSPSLSPTSRRILHIEYAPAHLPPPLHWHAA